MKIGIGLAACILLMGMLFPLSASATQVMYRTPQQLGSESEVVIRGRVESSESYWNEAHTKILTRTRIAVDESYKGNAPAAMDVLQLGGIVGPVKVTVHGALRWRVGEEVLLFAESHDATHYRVSGFSQGKYRIERDPETGEAFIRAPRTEGVEILGAPGGEDAGTPALGPGGDGSRVPAHGVALDEFVRHALGHASEEEFSE